MLFNSYAFLFVFLPITLAGYQLAGRFSRRLVIAWLGAASLAFYAYWRPAFLIVLLASIGFNYLSAALISRRIPNQVRTIGWLWMAIAVNLGALCYYKYLFTILSFLTRLAGRPLDWSGAILPLGISFFTFTQIAYLVDLQQGVAEPRDPISYILFVTFFPHLIAGPILHHKDMMPQFEQNRRYRLKAEDVAVGLSWFILGLAKKVLLADMFSPSANAAFGATGYLQPGAAWRGALCYTLELYFDFSGYSDMALGLARMFSIDFPLNFNSPYKSASVIEFWQRWHMTLSSYINDYLFSPIQFAVRGYRRRHNLAVNRAAINTPRGFFWMVGFPTLVTMSIAGIWHGAGSQFLMYGLLYGVFITCNHFWRMRKQRQEAAAGEEPPAGRTLRTTFGRVGAVLLTFACTVVAQVFFRAASTRRALVFLGDMSGLHRHVSGDAGLFHGEQPAHTAVKVAAGLCIVWFLPNTQQMLSRFRPSLEASEVTPAQPAIMRWSPNWAWALSLSCLLVGCLAYLQNASTFLYFQF